MADIFKKITDSQTDQVHIVMAKDINDGGRLFGGRLMEWTDILGGVVARRHSNRLSTTALIEKVEFKAPAFVGDTIFMTGRLVSVGNTSMRVRIESFVERLNTGERILINRCEAVYVALDDEQRPTRVPRLLPD